MAKTECLIHFAHELIIINIFVFYVTTLWAAHVLSRRKNTPFIVFGHFLVTPLLGGGDYIFLLSKNNYQLLKQKILVVFVALTQVNVLSFRYCCRNKIICQEKKKKKFRDSDFFFYFAVSSCFFVFFHSDLIYNN